MSARASRTGQLSGIRTRRSRIRLSSVCTHFVLVCAALIALYPIFLMFLNSFKSNSEVLRNPAGLPIQPTLQSYAQLATYQGNAVAQSFLNSLFVASVSTAGAVFLAALAAFAFAKLRFRGRDALFAVLLATLMVPGEVTLPPLYVMFARIHWVNTYQIQILPGIASVFGLFLIRQYMLTIPKELLEAARLDGASLWQQFWRIIVPVSAPVLGVFAILHFVGKWNDYLWPLIAVNSQRYQPIMTLLPSIKDPVVGFFTPWGMVMAGCVLVTVPLVVIFLLFQDKFVSSTTVGASKG